VIFVGDDWAEAHHDVYVCDEAGTKLASKRLPEGIDGMAKLHDLVATHAADPGDVVVGIETDRGLWVNALVEAGYVVYAINPKAASRYRDRHSLSGAKSDPGDAKMLGELVRTDRHNHRQVAGDTALAEGIKILARAHQTLVWERTRTTNRLRSSLREYFPAALATFAELADRDTLAVLAAAATPSEAARLTPGKIRTLLRRAGRQRNIETRADTIAAGLGSDALRAPAAVEVAHGATTRSSVAILAALNTQIETLAAELADHFEQHPDSDFYLSLPGVGVVLGARALGKFGDDPNRYADAKSRKNYAGTSPTTRASGTRSVVLARYVRNDRLVDALDQWAFSSITVSAGARAFYDRRRAAGDSHHKALRALGNRWVGILHGCLDHRTRYDENIAWGHRINTDLKQIAQAA
jgi:transposase